jgi:hypothetical protein
MHKKRFDDMFQSLSEKYEITSKIIPFVGDKLVELKDDDSLIMINAQHLSFAMDVSYVTNGLYDNFLNISNKNKQEKQDNEDSFL